MTDKPDVILSTVSQQLMSVGGPGSNHGTPGDAQGSRDKLFIQKIQHLIGSKDYGLILRTVEQ